MMMDSELEESLKIAVLDRSIESIKILPASRQHQFNKDT
jgi:hypothetical protein